MHTQLLLATARAAAAQSFWFPPQSSTTAAGVDRLFEIVLWISFVFFAIIVALMVLFVLRYRARLGARAAGASDHSMGLELTWTVIPSILVVVIFYLGAVGYMDMSTPPANAYEVAVTGQKWSWSFTYRSGVVSPDLHVPINEPVRLVMTSEDVIHSFFVPAFRVKMDVVPGRYTTAWFTATESGMFDVFCAEYCGTQHSKMRASVIVHPAGEFDMWLAQSGDPLKGRTPAQAGEYLYQTRGCKMCHSVDGTRLIGPSLKGLFGTKRLLADGSSVMADENYVRESLLEPMAKVVADYGPVMPTFQGKLKDAEITAINEYLKTLSP